MSSTETEGSQDDCSHQDDKGGKKGTEKIQIITEGILFLEHGDWGQVLFLL